MALPLSPSNLFLREEELRRGLDLLFFATRDLQHDPDQQLETRGLGSAHHRALYFIARHPDITVSGLLAILHITKQSLSRVLNQLIADGYIVQLPGLRDRRRRHLRLTEAGTALEAALFETQRERLTEAYSRAGAEAVAGFWQVLWHMIDPSNQGRVFEHTSPDNTAQR